MDGNTPQDSGSTNQPSPATTIDLKDLFQRLLAPNGGSAQQADGSANLNSDGWLIHWFDTTKQWELGVPQFKYCKKRKEHFSSEFPTIFYKAPYKYHMTLDALGMDQSDDVVAVVELNYEDGQQVLYTGKGNSILINQNPAPAASSSSKSNENKSSSSSQKDTTTTTTTTLASSPEEEVVAPPKKRAKKQQQQKEQKEQEQKEQQLQEEAKAQQLQQQQQQQNGTKAIISSRPYVSSGVISNNESKMSHIQKKKIDNMSEHAFPNLTLSENIKSKLHSHSIVSNCLLGPFQFNICSYKQDGRKFRMVLYLYHIVKTNNDNSGPSDAPQTNYHLISCCVSPPFTIRAKKPIVQPGIKKNKGKNATPAPTTTFPTQNSSSSSKKRTHSQSQDTENELQSSYSQSVDQNNIPTASGDMNDPTNIFNSSKNLANNQQNFSKVPNGFQNPISIPNIDSRPQAIPISLNNSNNNTIQPQFQQFNGNNMFLGINNNQIQQPPNGNSNNNYYFTPQQVQFVTDIVQQLENIKSQGLFNSQPQIPSNFVQNSISPAPFAEPHSQQQQHSSSTSMTSLMTAPLGTDGATTPITGFQSSMLPPSATLTTPIPRDQLFVNTRFTEEDFLFFPFDESNANLTAQQIAEKEKQKEKEKELQHQQQQSAEKIKSIVQAFQLLPELDRRELMTSLLENCLPHEMEFIFRKFFNNPSYGRNGNTTGNGNGFNGSNTSGNANTGNEDALSATFSFMNDDLNFDEKMEDEKK